MRCPSPYQGPFTFTCLFFKNVDSLICSLVFSVEVDIDIDHAIDTDMYVYINMNIIINITNQINMNSK